jgi:hypothetical protein
VLAAALAGLAWLIVAAPASAQAANGPFTDYSQRDPAAQKKKTKAKKASQTWPQVWDGDEDLAGYGALTFHMWRDGKAVMIDARETLEGTWTRDGKTVTLRFREGRIIYTGTINGDTISGTARDNRSRWNFSVRRSAGDALSPHL